MTKSRIALSILVTAFGGVAPHAYAVDQTLPGAGNALADQTTAASLRVRDAHEFLVRHARSIKNRALREATLDLLQNRNFCVRSRVGVDDAVKSALLAQLTTSGLINPADDASFPGGLSAGVLSRRTTPAHTRSHARQCRART